MGYIRAILGYTRAILGFTRAILARDVIRRLCNKDRDHGQKGIGVR